MPLMLLFSFSFKGHRGDRHKW